MKHLQTFYTILLSGLSAFAMASPDMDSENHPIIGLSAVSAKIQESANVQVLLPKNFSFLKRQYYAYLVQADPHNYQISIDENEDCRAQKTCRIGSFAARIGVNPEIYYNMENKMITEMITLPNGTKAFYTQGHAIASYAPPQIVWRCKNVLYELSWNEKNDKAKSILTSMASSALEAAKCS